MPVVEILRSKIAIGGISAIVLTQVCREIPGAYTPAFGQARKFDFAALRSG